MLFALPIVATAAASAHQFLTETAPIIEASASLISNAGLISAQRSHTISLNESGAIEGRVATIDAGSKANGLSDLKVFLVSKGEIQAETVTDADGLFSLANINEGVYSFVATGQSGFAAYGVRVVANNGSDTINLMEAAAVSPKAAVVKQILQKQLPSNVANQITENATVSEVAASVVGANKVKIQQGVLTGHVVPMLGEVALAEGTSIYLIQGNQQIAEVTADSTGSFAIQDVEPGVYDFVAAGPTGFAAVSFEAVEDAASAADQISSVVADSEEIPVSLEPAISPVAFQDIPADIPVDSGISNSLDVCLTCQQDAGFVGGEVVDAGDSIVYEDQFASTPIEYAGESVGCGAAAGGTCGASSNFSGYSTCGGGCNSCCSAASGGRGGLFGRLGSRFGGGGGLLGGSAAGGFGGGGLLAGGAGLGRLGLLAGVATAIAVGTSNDDDAASPDGS